MNDCNTIDRLEFKRGDTFELSATIDLPDEIELADCTINAQIRRPARAAESELIDNLDIELVSDGFKISAPHSKTIDWPLGRMVLDVQFDFPDGTRRSSNTIAVYIVLDQTE